MKFVYIATRLNILYIHLEFNLTIAVVIQSHDYAFEILSLSDNFKIEYPNIIYLVIIKITIYSLFVQIIWNCMTLKAFSSLRSPFFVQCTVYVESVFFPTVCFIPSYLNQHSISFHTATISNWSLAKAWKYLRKITLKIAWPMTIYFLHLYTIGIYKYTYSRDTYHMLFHMIDCVNLRSFKILMFKLD